MKFIFFLSIIILCGLNCIGEKKASEDTLASTILLILPAFSDSANSVTSSSGAVDTTQSSGIYTTVANASSTSEWVYVSLKESGKKATASSQWDIRFKRYVIGTNSGTSGSGSGGSCDTTKTNLLDHSINTSTCPLVSDSSQSQSGEGGFGTANESASPSMIFWYSYDGISHLLRTKNLVYLVRGNDGAIYSLQMLDYYSSAGTSGYMKFTWKRS